MTVRTALSIIAACMLMAAPALAERREPLPERHPAHPVLDASSYESMLASFHRMRERLHGASRDEFEGAIQAFVRSAEGVLRGVQDEMAYRDMQVQVLQPFDGMTAAQIIFELGRPPWASMRDERQQLERSLSRVAEVLYLHGVTQDPSHGAMFPPVSRVPGRVAPDLAWLPEQLHRMLQDPALAVSPFHPDADEWLDELRERGRFDAELFEAALSESYHYLSHAVMTEEEGQRYLSEYRLHAAKAVPGEVFLPKEFLRATPAMTEVLVPNSPGMTYAPLFIERPLYIGDPVIAVYPQPGQGPRFDITPIPFGTFPNTMAFMLGLEHLRDLDIAGRDPLVILGETIHRFVRAHADAYPPHSRTPGRLFFDASLVFPEHFSNGEIVIAAAHPEGEAMRKRLWEGPLTDEGFAEPERIEEIGAENYFYLHRMGRTQSEGTRIAAGYRQALESGQLEAHGFWAIHGTGEGQMLARGQIPFRAEFSAIRSLPHRTGRLPLFTNPGEAERALYMLEMALLDRRYPPVRGVQPLLMERPREVGAAVRVLFADLVLEEVPYGRFPNTAPFIKALEAMPEVEPAG